MKLEKGLTPAREVALEIAKSLISDLFAFWKRQNKVEVIDGEEYIAIEEIGKLLNAHSGTMRD